MFESRVEFGDLVAPVRIGRGLSEVLAPAASLLADRRWFLVSDTNVAPLYAQSVARSVEALGGTVVLLTPVAAGEASKDVAVVAQLWDALAGHRVTRGDGLLALGGGVVGDLTGFVASSMLRGIDWVQLPTSLLAMSDAGIGGKTGINLAWGKNLVGTFWHPRAVLADIAWCTTLSDRELRSAYAEIVKSALIAGPEALASLESDIDALNARDLGALQRGVALAAGVKIAVVNEDPRERGRRRVLNLGHTIGHAIEQIAGYGSWTHGEAVSAGLVAALGLSREVAGGPAALEDRIIQTLQRLSLPVRPPALGLDACMDAISGDKKSEGDRIRFVVCTEPGQVFDLSVSLGQIRAWLARQPFVIA